MSASTNCLCSRSNGVQLDDYVVGVDVVKHIRLVTVEGTKINDLMHMTTELHAAVVIGV